MASSLPLSMQYAFLTTLERTTTNQGIVHVENWLKIHPKLIHTKNIDGENVLFWARTAKVAGLLISKKRALIYEKNDNGDLPVHELAVDGNLEVVEFILNAVPSMIFQNGSYGRTPFLCACFGNQFQVVQMIYELEHATIDAVWHFGNALHAVLAGCGPCSQVLPLVEWIHNLRPWFQDEADPDGDLPIQLSTSNGNLELVKRFYRANPQAAELRDRNGRTLMHLAALRGHSRVVEWFLRVCPQLVNEEGRHLGWTPLLYACEGSYLARRGYEAGHADIVQRLSEYQQGAIDATDENGNTALHCVIQSQDYDNVLENYDDHDLVDEEDRQSNIVRVARTILRLRPRQYDAINEMGQTPLTLARVYGRTKLFEFLEKWRENSSSHEETDEETDDQ